MPGTPDKSLIDPRVVAENIIKNYGKEEFHRLIELFQSGASSAKIIFAFQVTRQRVAQWRSALGKRQVTFEPDPRIVDLLPRTESRGARRTVV